MPSTSKLLDVNDGDATPINEKGSIRWFNAEQPRTIEMQQRRPEANTAVHFCTVQTVQSLRD